ncbi:DUF4345 family protein [Aurantimonas sp. Leaf443]|uniref:AGROH133_08824 family phage infection protein n=1 Tax=Aurantimonas sp. Leaf443 TaxID=1736378 RepID=UPI0006FD053E|nr:DUF4345 family protein [Aurantimonas sp. Leaf443]KQT87517.1 hypothetical protein ASG48_17145 [Aurantimonas sp. Leaf443]
MEFTLPTTNAEWLPFGAACVTMALGVLAFFAPGLTLRALRLKTHEMHPEALAASRATIAGFWLGTGLVAAAFYIQTFTQMALGAGWLFSAFGRMVSMLSDRGNTLLNYIFLFVELALALACLAPAFGFVTG